MKQIICGLRYLGQHNILHRDISLANILLTSKNDVVSAVCLKYTIAVKIVAIFLPSKRMHSSHEQLPISRSRILTGAVKLF